MANKITCDKCGYEQGLSPITERMREGIERVYIRCGNCGEEYVAYYTDQAIRGLQREQRKLAAGRQSKRSMKRFSDNKEKLGIMMKELRERMEYPRG